MVKTRVKLIDIAKELEVSIATVSLVLSGKAKDGRVSEALSGKILNKANEMGYKVNHIAQSLRTGRSNILGLIVADISLPYFAQIIKVIEQEALRNGYQVMVANSDESVDKQRALLDMFRSRQVDGVIIAAATGSESDILSYIDGSMKVVLIDRYFKGVDLDSVCSDNYEGAYRLTNLLIEQGYKKIAAITYNDVEISSFSDRLLGFNSAITKSEVADSKLYEIEREGNEKGDETVIKRMLDDGCDAVFFINSALVVMSYKVFDKLGVKVGQDIAVVGYDNPDTYDIVKPGITCYEQPYKEMGDSAVQHLISKIDDGADDKIELFIDGELIMRDSHKKVVDENKK